MLPTIALLGRPNVGKSSLFNRLIRGNRAITHDRPGVTRDRMHGIVRRMGAVFGVVDTGGVSLDAAGRADEGPIDMRGFEQEVMQQAQLAMDESLALCLVVDGKDGLLPLDERLAQFVRGSGKPVLLVVNKVDSCEQEQRLISEFYALGLEIAAVSAAHGYGLDTLVERMVAMLPEPEIIRETPVETAPEESAYDPEPQEPGAPASPELLDVAPPNPLPAYDPTRGLRIAVLGKPNAGKSSLVNRLVGATRMIVSELAGTTRDSVDVIAEIPGPDGMPQRYTFVDTAGVRRRARIDDPVERFSVSAALGSGRKADVAIFLMDASEGVSMQDKRLLAYLDKEKIPFLIGVNKVDLVPPAAMEAFKKALAEELRICQHAPVLYVSALTGKGVDRVLDLAAKIRAECAIRLPTGQLNRIVTEAIARHQPPLVKGRRAKIYYLTQVDVMPPTFVFFVNDPERIRPSYARYLENKLRALAKIRYAPIVIYFRSSGKDRHEKK
jgi:GTP-binding protein